MGKVETQMEVLHVQGSLDLLLPKGMPHDENLLKGLINLPLRNVSGILIGRIDKVDVDNGVWYGRLVISPNSVDDVVEDFLKGRVQSMEVNNVPICKELQDVIKKGGNE